MFPAYQRQVRFTSDANPYERALLSDRNVKKGNNSNNGQY